MAILYNWRTARGLKWVCKRYGIDNPLPDLDGSKVAEMDRETLRKYLDNVKFATPPPAPPLNGRGVDRKKGVWAAFGRTNTFFPGYFPPCS
jgi:hypothetical protein